MTLTVNGLHVSIGGREILKGIDLSVSQGEIHVLMGPNGSGKSTLAQTIMGRSEYQITQGTISLDGENITNLGPDERARRGLFLAFQYPVEVPGVSLVSFLKTVSNQRVGVYDFRNHLKEKLKLLRMDEDLLDRGLNEGFSGGEKKTAEILQLMVLKPKIAILDETDSGLDIDSLKIIATGIKQLFQEHWDLGLVIITHYQRILRYIEPDYVHIMIGGKIVKSGGPELAQKLEDKGYESIRL